MALQSYSVYAKEDRSSGKTRRGDNVDIPFLVLVLLLLGIGLLMLYLVCSSL